MTKKMTRRVLAAAGSLAVAIGMSGLLATSAQAGITHPKMTIDVACSVDGKTATITAKTTDMGGFIYPDTGSGYGFHKLSRYITVNGVVVAEEAFTFWGAGGDLPRYSAPWW